MDFILDESQQAVSDLANQILSDRYDPIALTASEKNDEWFDKSTYAEIVKAGLLGIAVSEDVGGGGLGLVELGQVLEAQGRNLTPIPLMDTALAAIALDKYGSEDLRKAEIPNLLDGSVAAIGIAEWHSDDYLNPMTEATATGEVSETGEVFKITGTKAMVEFAKEAHKLILSANGADGAGLYLIDLNESGISMNEGVSTRHQKVHEIIMSGTRAVKISGADFTEADLNWFVNANIACLCAIQAGATEQALKMSAEYTSTREQFGRPIATFQAVTHRLADQYINVNGIRLTCYTALWTLDHIGDDPDLTDALATVRTSEAKWFASHLAMAVADATQHVHGGIGVDRDYPLHRYTLWNKHLQTTLGAGTQHLRRLGAQLTGI